MYVYNGKKKVPLLFRVYIISKVHRVKHPVVGTLRILTSLYIDVREILYVIINNSSTNLIENFKVIKRLIYLLNQKY